MSAETLAWALRIKLAKATTKHLLNTIADLANHITGEVFPSIAYLEEATGLAKRTVLAGIDELCEMKILERTEGRVGRTGQIPVYLFHMPTGIPVISRPEVFRTGAKTTPFSKEVQKRSETGAKTTPKEVQKRTTEPSNRNLEEEGFPPLPSEGTPPGNDLFGEELPIQDHNPSFVERVAKAWNAMADRIPGIASIDTISPSREKKISARGREAEKPGRTAWQAWEIVIQKIQLSTYLCGEDPPGKGYTDPFRLTLDFVLRPAEFLRILEGGYRANRSDLTHDPISGRRFGPAEQAGREAIARLRTPGHKPGNPGDQGRGPRDDVADGFGGRRLRSAFDQYRDDPAGRA